MSHFWHTLAGSVIGHAFVFRDDQVFGPVSPLHGLLQYYKPSHGSSEQRQLLNGQSVEKEGLKEGGRNRLENDENIPKDQDVKTKDLKKLRKDGSQDEGYSSLKYMEGDSEPKNLTESHDGGDKHSQEPSGEDQGRPKSRDGNSNVTVHMAPGSMLQIGNCNKMDVKKPRRPGLDYVDESSSNSEASDIEVASSVSRGNRRQKRGRSIPDWRTGEENSYRTESSSPDSFDKQSPVCGRRKLRTEVPARLPDDSQDDEDEAPCNLFIDVSEEMFHGRDREMNQLGKLLKEKKKVGVSGIGGAGKTTFVSLYALKNRQKYRDGIFFVDASLMSTLPVQFAKLAGPDTLNLIQQPLKNIETSMSLVMGWLMRHTKYLLVFDAADQEEILTLLGKQLPKGQRYIPPRLKGHVIITSQCPREKFQNVQIMDPMVLGDLDQESTCSFLWNRVYYNSEATDEEEMDSLTELVSSYLPGCLPILLEQTAAYIRGKNTTFVDYLSGLRSKHIERNPINNPCFGDNNKTVDVTFQANFESVERASCEAFCMLKMGALCHSKDIPLSLFTIGSLALMRRDVSVNEEFGDLQVHLLEQMEATDNDPIRDVAQNGIRPARQLLNISRERQLVKFNRGSKEFTVHEVIQQQLRLLMKHNGEIHSMLEVLANILLFMFNSDDLPLSEKRQYLSHAEACARHMETFGFINQQYTHLYLRLRIKTGHVFASLGSYSTAEVIVSDVNKKIPYEGAEVIKMELFGLKASVNLLKSLPLLALKHGKEALMLGELSLNIDTNDKEVAYELALIRKTHAETLLTMYEVTSDDVGVHLRNAMETFESVEKRTSITCQNHIAHLIMLQGVLHRRKGDQLRLAQRTQESSQQLEWALQFFEKASTLMNAESIYVDVTQVYHAETWLKSKPKPSRDELEMALIKLDASRQSLETKVTRNHHLVAWVLERMTHIQVDLGYCQKGLELVSQSQQILDNIYRKEDGLIQKGELIYAKGRALYHNKDIRGSDSCFKVALQLLNDIPNNPAFRMASAYLNLIDRNSPVMNPRML